MLLEFKDINSDTYLIRSGKFKIFTLFIINACVFSFKNNKINKLDIKIQ